MSGKILWKSACGNLRASPRAPMGPKEGMGYEPEMPDEDILEEALEKEEEEPEE